MPGHRGNNTSLDVIEADCSDVDTLYPALCEGALSIELATALYRHVVACQKCRERVSSFRAFLEQTSATAFLPSANEIESRVTAATDHMARWRELLNAWLDALYPKTVAAPVFRGNQRETVSQREQQARARSERPFLEAHDRYVRLVVHRARGRLLGRVDDPEGLPLFPVLVVLENSSQNGPVLNRVDGTFSTNWDPEATGIICWTPKGGRSRFPFLRPR